MTQDIDGINADRVQIQVVSPAGDVSGEVVRSGVGRLGISSDGAPVSPISGRPYVKPSVGCGYCSTCGYGGEGSPDCLHAASQAEDSSPVTRACAGCPSAHACQYGRACRWPREES